MRTVIGIGPIERIENGIAHGTFDTGTTFDVPVEDHAIGDEVQFSTSDDDDDAPYFMMVIGSWKASLFWLDETDFGYEIVGSNAVFKKAN